ncbi:MULTISPECIES: carbohydrate ABC transporter permease [Paenibacillus]|jgi:multiple sugar transport system permease protein|uniref:Carbohydrate ABC transporter membrane protein 1, CUT1 family (TC 3.A.1.1.-) n=1 Tax=Paenibacillus barengoltzii J12 TaxID=935846 RepID=A0ABY1LWD4_9BACL|nr:MULTISPECIES: sugar ABC transporter permease [Paenibacillus]MDU0330316.1 sugar ABC transporter permease [Paenibacillus sp. 3LSP]SME99333.1 carbohydrate ABC transporter membrane protein 1, CUT1 family (TC 3.A.1.1.-) [Paenibacillus barengoltzii J12]
MQGESAIQTAKSLTPHSKEKKNRWVNLKRELKRSKHYYVLMSPFMIIFFLFTVIPVVASFVLSFFYFNMLEAPRFIGWQNYSRLFLGDDIFLIALKNTLMFAVITGPISYIACFVFAWIINELSPKVRAIMTLIFYAPSISGNVYFIWLIIFSGDSYGYLNGFLMKIGIILEPIQWLLDEKYILGIVIIVQLWLSLGTSFLAFIAGLQTLDKSLIEAGAMDGIKNRWQELWYITLPSMRPQLMFGAVMQITTAFAVAEISIALAGFPSVNYAAHTIVTHLMDYGTIRFELGYASAIATFLFLLMVGTNKLTQKMLRKIGE